MKTRHSTKGHQLVNGKIWSGRYETQRDVDMEPIFSDAVYNTFYRLYNLLMGMERSHGLAGVASEARLAFEIHQQEIVRKQCNFLRKTPLLLSHRICLCCLYQEPVHPLLCGHVVCDQCLSAAGEPSREHVTRLKECPVCGTNWGQGRVNVEIVRKPQNCCIRVLTLDG